MSFEIFTPIQRAGKAKPGTAAINSQSRLLIHGADFRKVVGPNDQCVVMLDRTTFRVAVRRLVGSEPAVKLLWNKTKSAVSISLGTLLSTLGIDRKKARGLYDVTVKDNLLVVQLRV